MRCKWTVASCVWACVVGVLTATGIWGCDGVLGLQAGQDAGSGTLKVLITDAPFPFDLVKEATVTITRVEVHRVDADDDEDDGMDDDDGGEAADDDGDDLMDDDGADDVDDADDDATDDDDASDDEADDGEEAQVAGQSGEGIDDDDADEELDDHGADEADDEQEGDDDDDEDDDDDDSPWVVIADLEQEFNLLDLRNGRTNILADWEIPAGRYNQLRLIVTQGRIVVGDDTEEREFVLTVPSGEQTGIKLHFEFEVADGEETVLLLDVDLSRAFKPVPAGHVDDLDSISEFKFQPSLAMKLINVIDAGSISGVVTDADGNPLEHVTVAALRDGEEVGTTATEADGSYVLVGLGPGPYTVHFSADGFEELDVTDVEVVSGQETVGVNASLTPVAESP